MNSSTSNRRLLFLTMFLLALACFVGPAFAQKSDGQSTSSEIQTKLRQEVSKSVAGRLILDAITQKEPDWVISKGSFIRKIEPGPAGVVMSFERKKETVHISVSDFDTADGAERTFSIPRSYGATVPFKIGDRGEKVYSQAGRLVGLNFRVGNFRVSIGGISDEKLAERFAGHVLEAIKGHASK